MENLNLNGKSVSLKVKGMTLRTGKIIFGKNSLFEKNKIVKSYQVHILFDKNDIDFFNALKEAKINSYNNMVNMGKINPNNLPYNNLRNLSLKKDALFTSKGQKVVDNLYLDKYSFDLRSDEPIPLYDENNKLIEEPINLYGKEGAIIFNVGIYLNIAGKSGFKIYPQKIIVKHSKGLDFFD